MLLHTPLYLAFLTLTVLLYWATPKQNWRKLILLGASYVFYVSFDWRFALILSLLTLVVFWLGGKISDNAHSKIFAWLSAIVNLGVLVVFKYTNFFLGSLQTALTTLGFEYMPVGLQLLLPIGISFYTFQAISYTTEIYRKKLDPVDFLDFALYLSFFPKLIAGPLVRPRHFLEQLNKPKEKLQVSNIYSALGLLLLGLMKKVLIADSLGVLGNVAFRAAGMPSAGSPFPTPLYLQGFYLYAFQIYADFSGYTDIARASAALLGFNLPENFQQPYLATSITQFWNRWHMTLTQWFREYLFFPLSRKLLIRTHRSYPRVVQISANLITMTLIGLWHGAGWTFVIWGFWHGLLLSIDAITGIKPVHRWQKIIMGVITFHLVGVGWVLFGAGSFPAALHYLTGLFEFQQMGWITHYLPSILFTAILVFGIDLYQVGKLRVPYLYKYNWRPVVVVAGVVVITALTLLNMAHGAEARPFIYGQF